VWVIEDMVKIGGIRHSMDSGNGVKEKTPNPKYGYRSIKEFQVTKFRYRLYLDPIYMLLKVIQKNNPTSLLSMTIIVYQ